MSETVTTKELLNKIKETLLICRSHTGLDTVRTFKRGILPPIPTFPAIAIVPIREIHGGVWSGGKYEVTRQINLEVYSKKLSGKASLDQSKNIAKEIVNIGKKIFTWGDLVLETVFGGPNEEDPMEFGSSILSVCTVPMWFISYERIPDKRIKSGLKNITAVGLSELMERILEQHKKTPLLDLSLSKVAQLSRGPIPLLGNFPAVTINAPTMDIEKTYSSADTEIRHFNIGVWTKLLDKEINLDQNLDIIEVLKDLLQIYSGWNGYCISSEIVDIEYDMTTIPIGKVYSSTINYDCHIFNTHV